MINRRDPVAAFATGDRTILILAVSLLEGSGIRYGVIGDLIQDLFGLGRLGGINPVAGPIRILVSREDAEEARRILEPMAEVRPIRVPLILRVISWAALIHGVLGFIQIEA
jgi:hypothetical protein